MTAEASGAAAPTLTPRLVGVMATAVGVIVASLYYAQPLLAVLAPAFHASGRQLGLVVTLTQLGYALGLLLIVPLGDVLDRRRLVLGLLAASVLALLGVALARSLGVFMLLSVLVGLSAVSAQVLVPFAATLATPERRGRVVGTVMSGLLLGILLARTASGLIAEVAGWRSVYLLAALAVAALGLVLARALPPDRRPRGPRYPQLMASVLQMTREPLLRWRSLYGALVFAAFSVFWASLAFLLAGAPYHYSEGTIGLFGLLGAAGALAASLAGRMADRGGARRSTLAFGLLILLAFGLMLRGTSLPLLVLGILALDFGVQGLHVTNQSEVYRLPGEARSRITTVYLTSYFLGGVVGSGLAAVLYTAGGWTAVMRAGMTLGGLIVLVWLLERRAQPRV
ncbi:MFS transporter [Deinococcus sonorensis]|uniref:MFS transporter n=2 Tax=Deinococcus sonorensis TaxID=309891 RepID=A0AAU7UEW3_9DEIO